MKIRISTGIGILILILLGFALMISAWVVFFYLAGHYSPEPVELVE